MKKTALVLRIIYALCLAGATGVHLATHLQYGVVLESLEKYGYPVFTRVFWSSLTLLDPLAVALLFLRPRRGLILTAAIIVCDVAHNSWILYHFHGVPDPAYWAQVSFLLFLLATIGVAWRGLQVNIASKHVR